MLHRIFPSKDAFVTNYKVSDVQMTESNTGGSEILYLFKVFSDPQSGSMTHILTAFNTSSLPTTTGSKEYVLKMFNAQHDQTLPGSYDVLIRPVEQSWDEGKGIDLDEYTDVGITNWLTASSGNPWTSPGAYPTGALSATYHFDTGEEDLEVDVSSILSSSSLGFFLQLPAALEQDGEDYYIKMFHGRQTSFPWKRPYLEMRYEDWTGSTASFSGSVDPTGSVTAIVYDLKDQYYSDEDVTLHLSVYPKDWNPAVVTTSSGDTYGSILTNCYYRVVDDRTDEIVIPFGTGTIKYTKLSYDGGQQNYFRMRMGNIPTGSVYRLEFIYSSGSSWTRIQADNQFKFRVK